MSTLPSTKITGKTVRLSSHRRTGPGNALNRADGMTVGVAWNERTWVAAQGTLELEKGGRPPVHRTTVA
jgi:hypothetical protein